MEIMFGFKERVKEKNLNYHRDSLFFRWFEERPNVQPERQRAIVTRTRFKEEIKVTKLFMLAHSCLYVYPSSSSLLDF